MSKTKILVRWMRAGVVMSSASMCAAIGTDPLFAGSVFMKNGYIIQGPIVEESKESIVLGWKNGEVTIHRRLIESVSYDAGEEERLRELERARAEAQAAATGVIDEIAVREEEEDLPASVDVVIKLYGFDELASSTSGAGDVEVVSIDPSASGEPSDGVSVVDVVPQPSLAPEVVFTRGGELSMRPPAGWSVQEKNEVALQLVGPEDEEGYVPSLNVVAFERGPLPFEDFPQLLAESDNSVLTVVEPLSEGFRQLSNGVEVYERVIKGALEERTLVIRQVLIPHEDVIWLVTGFSRGLNEDPAFAVVQESLATLSFASMATSR